MRVSLLLPCLLAAACGRAPTPQSNWAQRVEWAHGVNAWRETTALRADVRVKFGDDVLVDHTFTFETNGPRARMESRADGVVVFDGETAWASGKLAEDPMARFHVLTWPWFIAAPFKLLGEDTRLSRVRTVRLGGKEYESSLQTFSDSAGDTPDDWYRLFVAPDTRRLEAMAYIVTYGTTVEQANESPSIILYRGFHDVRGVLLAHRWEFWGWNEADGLVGTKPKGTAELLTVTFVTPRPGTFEKRDGMVERPMP